MQVTPQQVYNEVLRQGGSPLQAQVGAALVDGIESNGDPTVLSGGVGPAAGLFQFEPGTWTGNGGGSFGPNAQSASWQQQVTVFLHASQGNNFHDWGPDLAANSGDPNSASNPNYSYSGPPQPGSKVANKLASFGGGSGIPSAVDTSGTGGGGGAGSASSTGAPAAPAEPTTSFNIPGIGKVQATGQQASALATFETNLQAYGFNETDAGQLTKWAWGEFTNGTDPSQIAIDFQQQPAFINQFPGFAAANKELTGSGNPAMSVAQYADYQHQALALAHAAGLPDGFINKENIGILAGGNVSHDELNQRINDAMSLAYNSTDTQRQAFNAYFGLDYNSQINQFDPMAFGQQGNPDFAQIGHGPLTTGQIAAISLDPTVAEPLIKNQITAAQLGGAYQTAGLGIAGQASGIDKATALQIAQSGVSQAAILGSANKNAVYAPLQTALPGQSGGTQVSATQLAAGDLLGDTNAQRALQTSMESRTAPFKGGGGDVATNKGVVGAGSASGTGSA